MSNPRAAAPAVHAAVTDDADERRAHLHSMWSVVAPSWAEHAVFTDARHARETAAMLELTTPRQGDRVLELACGAGGVGLAAAERVAPWGAVVLSDVAGEMTEIASARAHARGLLNLTTRTLDLELVDVPDASFEVALCRHGLHFTLDPVAAAKEIGRILRPTGRLAVSVWGPRDQNPWLAIVLDVVSAQSGRPVPPPGMPGPFALSDRERLAGLLAGAGLTDVQVRDVPVPMTADDFDEWWARTSGLAGPLSTILASLSDDSAASIRSRSRDAVAGYRTSAGYSFPGLALVASARRG